MPQSFSLSDNQHGTLVIVAVDAALVATQLPVDTAAASSDPTVATVRPNPGFPDQFIVQAVKAGVVNIVIAGTNAAGATISTTFMFAITGGPAVGFTATLINVASN